MNYLDQEALEDAGLRATHQCDACWPSKVAVHWPETECFMCGETLIHGTPEGAEDYVAWCEAVDQRFVDKVNGWRMKSGTGDWETHEIFQLRGDDPLRNAARSLSDYNSILKQRGYDPDTHRPDLSDPRWNLTEREQ